MIKISVAVCGYNHGKYMKERMALNAPVDK